jgi:L-ribulose-5-phosphate 3-epimerase
MMDGDIGRAIPEFIQAKAPTASYLKLFANPIALKAAREEKPMPDGAILVKENYSKIGGRVLILVCVIETGARFLLDPSHKHEPTLVSADASGRKIRLDFLKRALDIAARLEGQALSFWSGIRKEGVTETEAWDWLVAGCRELSEYAGRYGITLAFEPEPGMFIENLTEYQKLKEQDDNPWFGLTLDLGHAYLTEDGSLANCIRNFSSSIKNIHLEDMKKGDHKHLQFGDGQIDFSEVFDALKEIRYAGLINVELSRHSRNAVNAAGQAYNYLTKFRAFELRYLS